MVRNTTFKTPMRPPPASHAARTHASLGTLPRAATAASSARRRSVRPLSTVSLMGRAGGSDDDMDGATPRASHMDLTDMTSSLHRDEEERERAEQGDVFADPPAVSHSLPRMFRFTGRKAKRLRFYRNGDQYFKGLLYALRIDRVRMMKPLMEELTRSLSDSVNLPHGVRHVFSIDGRQKITRVDQFVDGHSYVCSSTDVFKPLDYANAREPSWSMSHARRPQLPKETAALALNITQHVVENTDFVFPRIITVIRNGVKPRKVVRHLLNKKTARSFMQVMGDLTEVVKLDSGVIRKLFALSGRQVTCLSDFFHDDDVFIAYGNERTAADDFFVIMEEYKRGAGRPSTRRTPRRRAMPARNESLRDSRAGSVMDSEAARQLPQQLMERLQIVRLLGDGITALVYEVANRHNDARHALKVISRECAIGKEQLIEQEICIMSRISHPHIVALLQTSFIDDAYYLELELVPSGDLFDHLCQSGRLAENTAATITRSLADALAYLHDARVVHRDVKPENLLLFESPDGGLDIKLADFGLASELPANGDKLMVICGTPTYVAAEVLAEWGYDEKVDVWAVGVILYIMLCGFPPFQSMDGDQVELFRDIMRGRLTFPMPSWQCISWSARSLIQHCVDVDVEGRITARAIGDNVWIKHGGAVPAEHEAMAELSVRARLPPDDEDMEMEEGREEETQREYFLSRRTSMDELSEAGDFSFRHGGATSYMTP